MEMKNQLAESESPYLLEAAHQPVHWQIYSDEVFKLARELDRPILLDIGAVWCHWCHVMDNESYSDAEVAEIINRRFVPVKVDRDQMPDVDSRYQSAVGALTGSGGWPLTGFLTSDGKVFFGGTYFARSDVQGRQGLLSLLPQVAEVYSTRRDEVFKSAEEIFQRLKEYELQIIRSGELSEETIRKILDDARSKFDGGFGGFGSAPKFFNPTTLLLLGEEALKQNDPDLKNIVEVTLDCISHGGVHDQLGGGFHRYSVDRYWHVPHFEKMLYDNALMIKAYLIGFQFSHRDLYARVARQTADWIVTIMKSPEGPFYAHQDADVEPSDDGTYWTWTKKEIENVLTEEERKIAELYFDIRELPNDIHEFPDRNVLRAAVEEKGIAQGSKLPEEGAVGLIEGAKIKLLESRDRRKAPFIDKTVFADRNGLTISALVEASVALREEKYFRVAEKAADFIIAKMINADGRVAHAFSGKSVLYQGLLDDNVYFGTALLDLFDVARNDIHLEKAERVAEVLVKEFEDVGSGGFFDRSHNAGEEGLLATKKKPIEDTPTPSGNSGVAIFFDRLFTITENKKYFEVADRTLKAFAGSVDKIGIYAANYGRALRFHLNLSRNVR